MPEIHPAPRFRSIGLLALALAALLARRPVPPPSGGAVRRESHSLAADGRPWSYTAIVPDGPGDGGPMPVLLALHGSAGSGAAFVAEAGWDEVAARERVLVIAPDGLPLQPDLEPDPVLNPRLWNSGQHAADRPRSRIDDLAFFDALLDDVARRWPVDPGRVYVVGHSCGGAMALRLAAERPERVAAVASVAGLAYVERPADARGVPTVLIYGGADPLLPGEGGFSMLPWELRRTPPINHAIRDWAAATGCPPTPGRVIHDGSVHTMGFDPGPDGATVTAVLLDGHGHAWPGGHDRRPPVAALVFGPRTDAIDATAVIWADLARHRL